MAIVIVWDVNTAIKLWTVMQHASLPILDVNYHNHLNLYCSYLTAHKLILSVLVLIT